MKLIIVNQLNKYSRSIVINCVYFLLYINRVQSYYIINVH